MTLTQTIKKYLTRSSKKENRAGPTVQSLLAQNSRMYKAAQPSRLGPNAITLPVPMDYIVRSSQRVLRARSRWMFENNEMIRRYVQVMVTNVIGHHGIMLAPIVEKPDGTLDTVANQALQTAFERFGQAEYCTVTGDLDFKELQRVIVRTLVMDGEAFIRIHQGANINDLGFALQLIDPELINVYDCTPSQTGSTYVEAGIEYDSQTERPVAYRVSKLPRGMSTYTYGGGDYIRVPADEMLHIFHPERIGQRRGLPWTATVAETVTQHNEFTNAAVVAARVGASTMAVIESPGGDLYPADASNDQGQLFDEVEAGMVRQLPAGMTMKQFDGKYPNTMYADFSKAILRQIASGLGVSYNTLASDMESVSYSSMRVGVADDRENFMVVQDLLINRLLRPVYNAWLRNQLLQENITVPTPRGSSYALKLVDEDKYRCVRFQPKKWAPVDETKKMNADVAAITQGLKSRSAIIRESGNEPAQVWQEISAENKLMDSLGVKILEKDEQVAEKISITE